jgi:hypothetical protein
MALGIQNRNSSHHAEHGDTRAWEREAYRNDARLVKHGEEQSEILLQVSKTVAYVDHQLSQKQISDFKNYILNLATCLPSPRDL